MRSQCERQKLQNAAQQLQSTQKMSIEETGSAAGLSQETKTPSARYQKTNKSWSKRLGDQDITYFRYKDGEHFDAENMNKKCNKCGALHIKL